MAAAAAGGVGGARMTLGTGDTAGMRPAAAAAAATVAAADNRGVQTLESTPVSHTHTHQGGSDVCAQCNAVDDVVGRPR